MGYSLSWLATYSSVRCFRYFDFLFIFRDYSLFCTTLCFGHRHLFRLSEIMAWEGVHLTSLCARIIQWPLLCCTFWPSHWSLHKHPHPEAQIGHFLGETSPGTESVSRSDRLSCDVAIWVSFPFFSFFFDWVTINVDLRVLTRFFLLFENKYPIKEL